MHAVETRIAPASPLALESRRDAAAHLQHTLPFITGEPPTGTEFKSAYVLGYTFNGGPKWLTAEFEPVSATALQSTGATEKESALIAAGLDHLRDDNSLFDRLTTDDGRWWQAHKPSQEEVETKLREVVTLEATNEAGEKRTLDVLNTAGSDLTGAEIEDLRQTIEKVGNYTRGKTYSRVKGVIVASDSAFFTDSNGVIASGTFYNARGILHLNLDSIRRGAPLLIARFERYFRNNGTPSVLALVTAHELGHGMDVNSHDEAAIHDLHAVRAIGDTGLNYSVYDALPSWRHELAPGKGEDPPEKNWKHDPTIGAELGENPPTAYAHTKPGEDLGDTFTIASLGGDMSQLPVRNKLLRDMVDRVPGEEMGTSSVIADRLAVPPDGVYRPHKLQALKVGVYFNR